MVHCGALETFPGWTLTQPRGPSPLPSSLGGWTPLAGAWPLSRVLFGLIWWWWQRGLAKVREELRRPGTGSLLLILWWLMACMRLTPTHCPSPTAHRSGGASPTGIFPSHLARQHQSESMEALGALQSAPTGPGKGSPGSVPKLVVEAAEPQEESVSSRLQQRLSTKLQSPPFSQRSRTQGHTCWGFLATSPGPPHSPHTLLLHFLEPSMQCICPWSPPRVVSTPSSLGAGPH